MRAGWSFATTQVRRRSKCGAQRFVPGRRIKGCAPFPSSAGKGAVEAGRMGYGQLLRTRQVCTTTRSTFDDASLLSTPHPSGFARHLPHFVEKGARNRPILQLKRLTTCRRLASGRSLLAHPGRSAYARFLRLLTRAGPAPGRTAKGPTLPSLARRSLGARRRTPDTNHWGARLTSGVRIPQPRLDRSGNHPLRLRSR